MKSICSLVLVGAVSVFASGCSMMAPQYASSMDNVQLLKNSSMGPLKVGTFASVAGANNPAAVSLRGNSMNSPYEGSYSRYLAEALQVELALANKHAAGSDVELSGELVKNSIDASGFSTGNGEIQARFVVKKSGEVRYDQVKSARHEWPSSFVGSVAIPRAVQEYPNLVQKLLASLYADPAFQQSTK